MGVDKILLDTHVLLWWWSEPEQLSLRARELLQDRNVQVFVSAASAWEISTKTRIGKLPMGNAVVSQWNIRLEEDGFLSLPIHASHSLLAGSLESPHRDPFDRMLGAQSIIEVMPLISKDVAIDSLGVNRIW
ncbi:MAG: type II toxin-antitoxin system VapC family toxin [Spirochaetales bacterium]|nr:type II toxin-antitoxin system VapC family toxin [Spirochaetales bacterium]